MSLWQNCHDKRFLQVSTATKIELVEGLVAAGLQQVEVTSFVSPVWVPQLADAAELCASISRKKGVKYPVLVPNLKASTARFYCTQGRLSRVFVTLLIFVPHVLCLDLCRVFSGHMLLRQLKLQSSQQRQSSSARRTPTAAFRTASNALKR